MKKFDATKVDEDVIELTDSSKLAELWNAIEASENFILSWKEGKDVKSKLMIGTNLVGRVKDCSLVLCSRDEKGVDEK